MAMFTSNDMPLAASALNRAAQHRTDKAWLERATSEDSVLALLLRGGKPLMMNGTNGGLMWLGPEARDLAQNGTRLFLGLDKNRSPIFAFDLPPDFRVEGTFLVGTADFEDMRGAISRLSPLEANLASTARSLFEWHRFHRFCANCGSPSDLVDAGWKRICPACATEHFPRTDPVAIMLPVSGEDCLLGRSPGWPAGFMSCLAGFVEPGETIEQAASRELFEEAGIRSDPATARYLFCQPWPFPSSLMVGIELEATSREINVDPKEIEDARWFSRNEVRQILAGSHAEIFCPPKFAIAHHVLKQWAERD